MNHEFKRESLANFLSAIVLLIITIIFDSLSIGLAAAFVSNPIFRIILQKMDNKETPLMSSAIGKNNLAAFLSSLVMIIIAIISKNLAIGLLVAFICKPIFIIIFLQMDIKKEAKQ